MFIRGEIEMMTHRQVSYALEVVDRFGLSEDGILYYLGRCRESKESMNEDLKL